VPAPAALARDDAAAVPRDRADYFQCYLADQPEYLVPERLCAFDGKRPAGPLMMSRNAWLAWRENLPPSIANCYPLPEMFLPSVDLAWVDDAVTGMQLPFWVGPWFRGKLEGLSQGQAAPAMASYHSVALLAAGVLERPGDAARRAAEWNDMVGRAASRFAKDGFVAMPPLVHPFHLGSLRSYYRRLLRTGGMTLGDNCSPTRYVVYQESVAQFFHRQIAHAVSAVANMPVKPTFVYSVSYPGGADLEVHTDRAQCEYAVSLLVDYTPEPLEQSPWPMRLNGLNGTRKIWQALGDAVLYRGTRIPHWRDQLAASATSTSLLFYYVNENFTGSLD
jgi:hypothetical protein